MARVKAEHLVVQSVLDRLRDYDDWPSTRNASLAMFKDGIKRDMEWLLNSRKPHLPTLESYKEAAASVLNYGLPDLQQFGSVTYSSDGLLMAVLEVIRTFEPRIQDARVTVARTDSLNRSVQFHVSGRLLFENGEEDINFDTVLDVISGDYDVK